MQVDAHALARPGFWVLYAYLSGADLSTIVRTMSSFLAIVGTADVIRLNNPAFERFYESVLGALMREAEKVSLLREHSGRRSRARTALATLRAAVWLVSLHIAC